MAEMFDRYRNVARRNEGLILPANAPLPSGAVASEWKKDSTVSGDRLTAIDKTDLDAKGYRYFKMDISFQENPEK